MADSRQQAGHLQGAPGWGLGLAAPEGQGEREVRGGQVTGPESKFNLPCCRWVVRLVNRLLSASWFRFHLGAKGAIAFLRFGRMNQRSAHPANLVVFGDESVLLLVL